jgi:hypothetical protein
VEKKYDKQRVYLPLLSLIHGQQGPQPGEKRLGGEFCSKTSKHYTTHETAEKLVGTHAQRGLGPRFKMLYCAFFPPHLSPCLNDVKALHLRRNKYDIFSLLLMFASSYFLYWVAVSEGDAF